MLLDTRYLASRIRGALVTAGALASLAGPAAAQQRILTVRVLDSAANEPIRRAAVEPRLASPLDQPAAPSALVPRFTDAQGRARFAFATDDSIDFTVRSIGFASAHRVIEPGANDTVTIRLTRLPVHLDALVATGVDNNCPSGMGRAADQVDWVNVTNALAIAADYEAESTFSFEVRSFQRLKNLDDAVTDESDIIERSGAVPSISAQSADWLAENGFFSRHDDTLRVEVPSPSVLGSPTFERTHCFIFAGDSEGLVRLRFAPQLRTRVADVSGEMLLADSTLAPLAVQLEYGLSVGPGRATLTFDQTHRGTMYLRQLSLDLPKFDGDRPAGTISEGQQIQLVDGAGGTQLDVRRAGNVRVEAQCGTLSLEACLGRGNDEWSGKLNGERDPLRALAYYGAVCRAGPSRPLAQMANDTTATEAAWLAVIDAGGGGIDSAGIQQRSAVIDALATKRPDELAPEQRTLFENIVQLDACSRRGIVLGFERAALGIRSEGARTSTLIASCMEGEGLACLWAAPAVAALEPSDAAARAEHTLLERACALEVARACERLTPVVTIAGPRTRRGGLLPADSASQKRSRSVAREFLTEAILPSQSLVDWYAVRLADDFADRAMTDLDVLPGGVVETINPEVATTASTDAVTPVDGTELDVIADLLRNRRELRALVVIHTSGVAGTDASSRESARGTFAKDAAGYEAWFREHGVSSDQLTVVDVPQGDVAASPSTLLGRQVQRRVEIAIRVPAGEQ